MSAAPARPRRRRLRIARPDRWLVASAGVLAVAGLTLLLRPPTLSVVSVPPTRLALPATPAAILASDPAALDAIVRANVFSVARTPPRTRYVPPDATPTGGDPIDEGVASEEVAESVPLPQLYGTVVGAGGSGALIAVDPAAPAAQLYRVGDRAGGWRVVRIGDRTAVLDGPGGRVTLRLRRSDGAPPSTASDSAAAVEERT